jgi:hypothetical protein
MFTVRRTRIFIFCCLLAAGAVFLVKDFAESGPRYNGHSLRAWLRIYGETDSEVDPATRQKAANAVQQIGTNAIPYLIKWIDYHPGEQLVFQSKSDFYAPRMQKWRAGFDGLDLLGTNASKALPLLIQIMNDNVEFKTVWATTTLGYLGKDAMLPLAKIITNTTRPNREFAIRTAANMTCLGTNIDTITSALLDCTKDSNINRAIDAVRSLLALKAESQFASAITNGDKTGRSGMIMAVEISELLTQDKTNLITALIRCTEDQDTEVAVRAIAALKLLKGNPPEVAAANTRALGSANARIRTEAVEALYWWSNAQIQSVVPILKKMLNDEDDYVRREAERLLKRVDPNILTNALAK